MKVRPAVVIIKDGNLLLMKYNYNGTFVYGIPGGNPDNSETLEQTLKRELKEELSIEIKLNKLILIGEVILEDRKTSTLHCIFSGEILNGIPQINSNHTTSIGVEWIKLDVLSSLNLYPNIADYLKNINLPDNNIYIGKIKQKWFD
ncbi:MAG: NUDIX domain-containing protein [Candidatus Firestonebacteria bacterium]|nr:NUDIX domain-containing protein [Candidatus Firestonebacteria bacterium]